MTEDFPNTPNQDVASIPEDAEKFEEAISEISTEEEPVQTSGPDVSVDRVPASMAGKNIWKKLFHPKKDGHSNGSSTHAAQALPSSQQGEEVLSCPDSSFSKEELQKLIEEQYQDLEGRIREYSDQSSKTFLEARWTEFWNGLQATIDQEGIDEIDLRHKELAYWTKVEKQTIANPEVAFTEKIDYLEQLRGRKRKLRDDLLQLQSKLGADTPRQIPNWTTLFQTVEQQKEEIQTLSRIQNRTAVFSIALTLLLVIAMGVAGIFLPRGNNGNIYAELAWLYQLEGRDKDAEHALKQGEAYGFTTWDALAKAGETYRKINKFDAAAIAFERSIQLNPKNVDLRVGLARSYAGLKRNQDSIDQYQQAIQLAPPGKDFIYIESGSRYIALGNPEQALVQYQHALDLNPKSASAYFLIGEAQRALQNSVEAEAAFKKAVDLQGDNYAYLIGLGRSNLDQGDYNEALAAFEQAVVLDTDKADGFFYEGEVYRTMENYAQAVEKYSQAIAVDSSKYKYFIVLGDTYRLQNNCVNSTQAYASALKLNANSQAARDGLTACKGKEN